MNEIEVLALVAKATYIVNHLYETIQNVFLHDARLTNVMVQPIAIAFQHIFLVNPIIQLTRTRNQSATIVENETHRIPPNKWVVVKTSQAGSAGEKKGKRKRVRESWHFKLKISLENAKSLFTDLKVSACQLQYTIYIINLPYLCRLYYRITKLRHLVGLFVI